ncbi:MAG: lipoprotein [Pseudomonadaceae bacterium]|nr:lipoprotein [Pseudomonadaceae bacterium]
MYKYLALALLVLLVAGCGQKGDLYLPQPEAKLTNDLRA